MEQLANKRCHPWEGNDRHWLRQRPFSQCAKSKSASVTDVGARFPTKQGSGHIWNNCIDIPGFLLAFLAEIIETLWLTESWWIKHLACLSLSLFCWRSGSIWHYSLASFQVTFDYISPTSQVVCFASSFWFSVSFCNLKTRIYLHSKQTKIQQWLNLYGLRKQQILTRQRRLPGWLRLPCLYLLPLPPLT